MMLPGRGPRTIGTPKAHRSANLSTIFGQDVWSCHCRSVNRLSSHYRSHMQQVQGARRSAYHCKPYRHSYPIENCSPRHLHGLGRDVRP
jgi:hypothetical protein